jgi:hypothetical protein
LERIGEKNGGVSLLKKIFLISYGEIEVGIEWPMKNHVIPVGIQIYGKKMAEPFRRKRKGVYFQ